MTTNAWQDLLVKCRYNPKIVPIFLAFVRIALCLWPQTGYLHPDEFKQSSDLVAGNYFSSNIHKAWEFDTNAPIRCMLIPNLLNNLAFKIITFGSIKAEPSAYWLLVAPRLVYTLFSFLIDYFLYKLCQYYSSRGLWYLPVSVIFQSSFICLGCLTRTINNLPEVVLFAALLVLVCQTIRPRFRVLFVTPNRTRPTSERIRATSQYSSSIMVGQVLALGTFNRPTFPCFALVPMLYWFTQSCKRNSHDTRLIVKRALTPLAMSAIFTSTLISLYDTAYYKDLKTVRDILKQLLKFEFDQFWTSVQTNWVLTPYNFLRYNTKTENLSKYGLHLPYTHMLINVPVYFNLLGLAFLGKLLSLLVGSGVYRLIFSTHRIYSMMLLSTVTSIILLSFVPHQEFRFLLPIIVPLAYTFAFEIYASNRLLSLWLITNLSLLYFYSSIHQVGVTKAAMDLSHILKQDSDQLENSFNLTRVNVMAFRCYDVPSYLWNIPNNDKKFNLDIGDTFADFGHSLDTKLDNIPGGSAEFQAFYVMLPTIYENNLFDTISRRYQILQFKAIQRYAPHFTGEDFGRCLELTRKRGLVHWKEIFSFSLIGMKLGELELATN